MYGSAVTRLRKHASSLFTYNYSLDGILYVREIWLSSKFQSNMFNADMNTFRFDNEALKCALQRIVKKAFNVLN